MIAPVASEADLHEHTWALRSVDLTDGAEVREYACAECPSVWFD